MCECEEGQGNLSGEETLPKSGRGSLEQSIDFIIGPSKLKSGAHAFVTHPDQILVSATPR